MVNKLTGSMGSVDSGNGASTHQSTFSRFSVSDTKKYMSSPLSPEEKRIISGVEEYFYERDSKKNSILNFIPAKENRNITVQEVVDPIKKDEATEEAVEKGALRIIDRMFADLIKIEKKEMEME